jgi:hypothetical protein
MLPFAQSAQSFFTKDTKKIPHPVSALLKRPSP